MSAQFLTRLNLIEGSKLPLCVSFICEDYGYNMGKIEEDLGFKIHVAQVDKNYFNIKDISDYPLDEEGRIKQIENLTIEIEPSLAVAPVPEAPTLTAPVPAPTATVVEKKAIAYPKMQPRSADAIPIIKKEPIAAAAKVSFESKQQSKPSEKFEGRVPGKYPEKSENKFQDKFIRRDDKAKEALDAARLAAQEKRKSSQTNQNLPQSGTNLFAFAAHLVQDALKAATEAAKQSMAHNLEQNMPTFSSLFSKIPFLKKASKNKE